MSGQGFLDGWRVAAGLAVYEPKELVVFLLDEQVTAID
jgi:hypothetical protein